jgi:uncharacterized protein YggE
MVMEGEGWISVAPDTAEMDFGVLASDASPRDAGLQATQAANRVLEALSDKVDEILDLGERVVFTTRRVSLQTVYGTRRGADGSVPVIASYEARSGLSVQVRNLEASDAALIGSLFDVAGEAGVNTLSGPVFSLRDKAPHLEEVRRIASGDALARARAYAQALNLRRGRIISVVEASEGGFRPMAYAERGIMVSTASASAAPVIEIGEEMLSMRVSVTWELID